MSILIDTNIAIHLRDGEPTVIERVDALPEAPFLSIVTQIELEGGVYRHPHLAAMRRALVDALLADMAVLEFSHVMAGRYREIVAKCGFSRPRILDRMIAATAIVHDLTLITINGDDFRDIPGLRLEVWPGRALAQ